MIGGTKFIDFDLIFDKINLKHNMKLADLGCGAVGKIVLAAAKKVGKRGVVYAVDIQKSVLNSIQKSSDIENFENIKTVWGDLEVFGSTKIENSSIDITTIVNTLHQTKKRSEVLREAKRITKKNGLILVVDWRDSGSSIGPELESRINTDLLLSTFRKLGLNKENEFEVGPYHFGQIYIKT